MKNDNVKFKSFIRPRMRKILSENRNELSVKKSRAMVGARSAVDSDFSETSSIFSKFYRCAAVFSAAFLPPKKRRKNLLGEFESGKDLVDYFFVFIPIRIVRFFITVRKFINISIMDNVEINNEVINSEIYCFV